MSEQTAYTLLGLIIVAVALLLLVPWAAVGFGLTIVVINEWLEYRASRQLASALGVRKGEK